MDTESNETRDFSQILADSTTQREQDEKEPALAAVRGERERGKTRNNFYLINSFFYSVKWALAVPTRRESCYSSQ